VERASSWADAGRREGPAYWPWVQSLRVHVEQTNAGALRAELAGGAAEVAQILPEVRDVLPDLAEPSLEEEGARFRLFDALARFLRNAASKRPLVLVLDDLHAADEPSLLMLRFVAGELGDSRILLVGTYRDVDPTVRDPLAATLAELAREPVTRRIDLHGLAPPDVARYIELNAGTSPSDELVAAIHSETEGNPLFVGEVVRLLASEGRLTNVDAGALWAFGIPQGVREVIGRRIGRLSPESTRVLTLAAVLGREFGLDGLERLSEVSSDELLDILDEAVAARLLTSVPGAPARLRFAHALIRETLYDQLTTVRRGQLHRRAGEALESLYELGPEPHLAELAYHFFEAAPGGDVDKALAYARRAADRALDLLAYEEAARFYELALQALELRPSDPVEHCDLLLALGDALARAGSTAEAKDTFQAAADLARSAGLSGHLARAALGYGGRFPWLRAGNDIHLVPLLREAIRELGEEESPLRVRVLARLAGALRDEPSLEPRASLARRAVEIARQLDDTETLAYALVSLAPATWGPDLEEFDSAAEEVSELATASDNPESALLAGWLNHIRWMTRGEIERVAALGEADQARADALKQPSQRWYSTVRRCVWALFQGRFDEAEALSDEALRHGTRAVAWDAGCSHRFVLFMLRREQGRLAEVDSLIRRSVAEYRGYRSFPCFVVLLDLALGRANDARRAFDELARDDFGPIPRDGEWLSCLSLLSEVAHDLADPGRAAILYRLLLPYADLNALAAGEVALGSISRYLGLLATALGGTEAARHFEDALEMNERMGARPWVAHTQEDYARLLLAHDNSGEREKGQKLLETALATYRELGMQGPLARAEAMTAR
jgi:tetratricopeptide (TPR) repeat protein